MTHIAVLGGGMVGALIAHDLAADNEVRLLDRSTTALAAAAARTPGLATQRCDAERDDLAELLDGCAVAVNCLPGALGHRVLRRIIASGVACADIAFTPEDPLALDDLARERGVAAVVDCGIAPGLSNLLAGELVARGAVARLEIWVGGLPRHPEPPWFYKAPFSPADVLEEYTRPARVKRGGRVVAAEPLTERHEVQITLPRPGSRNADGTAGVEAAARLTLEAALTDGLRTLLALPVDEMAEYTLRWPGHYDRVLALHAAGLLGTAEVAVDERMVREAAELGLRLAPGRRVVPRAAVAEALFAAWQLAPDEPEFTCLRVAATAPDGARTGWVVSDEGGGGWSSMARTTGHTAAAFARLLRDGLIAAPGVYPPEAFGARDEVVARVLGELRARGVEVRRDEGATGPGPNRTCR